ncbi:MAG: hypothetical protein KDA60_21980, partial [Planctomycetales bacterium]|nr:hypothetical protein [Planctomycetales bacterium]
TIWPTDPEAFGSALTKPGLIENEPTWTEVTSVKRTGGGFVIHGTWSDGEQSERVFAVLVEEANVLCRGSVKQTRVNAEALVADAIRTCQSARM